MSIADGTDRRFDCRIRYGVDRFLRTRRLLPDPTGGGAWQTRGLGLASSSTHRTYDNPGAVDVGRPPQAIRKVLLW
jgi:hypothetical protein